MTRALLPLLLALGCATDPDAPAGAGPDAPAGAQPPGGGPPGGGPPGGAPASLALPADSPEWATLDGFLDHPGRYGEASWDDVRMRVVQHVAAIGRDRARTKAAVEDYAGCAAAYADTAARLDAISTASATGAPVRAALAAAARRDAAFCDALARGAAPADPGEGIASLRARYAGLALAAKRGEPVADAARALATEARAVDAPALDLAGFADFEARHALRVRLVEAYADAVDPLRIAEPWGHWEADEVARVADALADAAERLAAGPVADPWDVAPRRAPVPFSAEGLGTLPTGDSLVDTAGFPGPKAIGTLSVLSLEDPAHRAWLEEQAATLNALPPAEVPDGLARVVAKLEAEPYGSRYYNAKQARNAAVRALASRGAFAEARTVLRTSWPLHAQDWACPNRGGILRAIEGRLLAAAGDPEAEATLAEAQAESDRFLAHVAEVERRGPPPPPSGGAPRGAPPGPPNGGPPHGAPPGPPSGPPPPPSGGAPSGPPPR